MKIRRSAVEHLVLEALLCKLQPRGYVTLDSGALVRAREGWREGIFVQLSSPPAQLLCAVAGVDVPMAVEYASGAPAQTFSAAVGGRLSERGIGNGDQWFPAETQEEIESAAGLVASLVEQNEPWFQQFRSVRDVADSYFRQKAIQPLGDNDYWKQVFVLNYACMLRAANSHTEATQWLKEAERVIRSAKTIDRDDRVRLMRVSALLEE